MLGGPQNRHTELHCKSFKALGKTEATTDQDQTPQKTTSPGSATLRRNWPTFRCSHTLVAGKLNKNDAKLDRQNLSVHMEQQECSPLKTMERSQIFETALV